MILDAENSFSEAQAITVSALSTNFVFMGPGVGIGRTTHGVDSPPIEFQIDEAFTAAGAATLTIDIRTSDNADMSSATIVDVSPAIPKASLVVGGVVPWPARFPWKLKSYVALYYTVGTGPFTAGKITARAAMGRQTNN